MGITRRWGPTDPEYQESVKYIATTEYQEKLRTLQSLVVKRLLELHHMNLAKTGAWNSIDCVCSS